MPSQQIQRRKHPDGNRFLTLFFCDGLITSLDNSRCFMLELFFCIACSPHTRARALWGRRWHRRRRRKGFRFVLGQRADGIRLWLRKRLHQTMQIDSVFCYCLCMDNISLREKSALREFRILSYAQAYGLDNPKARSFLEVSHHPILAGIADLKLSSQTLWRHYLNFLIRHRFVQWNKRWPPSTQALPNAQ